jgi:hypothetical protein
MSLLPEGGDDVLAEIDLYRWQVPPSPDHRPAILLRAFAPTPAPRRSRRVPWLVAAAFLLNAAIAALLAIVLSRPAAPVIAPVRPAGGPAEERALLRQLEDEQAELERRIAELEQLRTLTSQLAEKLRRLEDRQKPERPAPKRADPKPSDSSCDEVTCTIGGYQGACCQALRAVPDRPAEPNVELDRVLISAGMAAVRARVRSCFDTSAPNPAAVVRVQVRPDGSVARVSVEASDAAAIACVSSAVAHATFARTKNGGSFKYPFAF